MMSRRSRRERNRLSILLSQARGRVPYSEIQNLLRLQQCNDRFRATGNGREDPFWVHLLGRELDVCFQQLQEGQIASNWSARLRHLLQHPFR